MLDYHIHTWRCCHASGEMREYLAEAEKKGLAEIGFADHFPLGMLGVDLDEPVSMQPEELDEYIADVQALQKSASIPVRLGVEVDYLPGQEELTAMLLKQYPFDYVIGSIHFVKDWDFTHPDYIQRYEWADIDKLYEDYFAEICRMAKSGLFDIVGHLDVVKKFSFFPRKSWDHLVEETCRILKEADICVELNSAGWRAPVREAYPGEVFLAQCQDIGIPVTMGSDAHRPKEVGCGLRRAALILDKIGFTEVASFAGGKRTMRPLELTVEPNISL
ncbi:histidinol-phosphatase HisJ family protein [Dethiobacter alkaliphilus]|uniref:histidinol-phosphatase HisJ family protein n=1 Tax=Dethiobacter alkaliphilus TaxID=427926 RepID=UPI002226EAE1|nr:histidinol-phosphatase HisJ family protein [Dethiobacter alkaliphilus]MCW3491285.1 histidinol-phosphatase HisJ family protein [Dethiobacter alkaliphilus]